MLLPPFGFFSSSKACDGHPGRVWHWWLGEGIISMSKISSPCQTCQLLHTQSHKHTYTDSKHAGKPEQRPLPQICFFFFFIFFFFFHSWLFLFVHQMAHESIRIHMWHRGGCCSSLTVRCSAICPEPRAERCQHLAPRHQPFCFLMAPFKHREERKSEGFVCFLSLTPTIFPKLFIFSAAVIIQIRNSRVQNTRHNLYVS